MPVGRDTVLIMTGRTQEGFMHSENIIYKNAIEKSQDRTDSKDEDDKVEMFIQESIEDLQDCKKSRGTVCIQIHKKIGISSRRILI